MIKLLHFADFHLGMENHGRMDPETGLSSRVRDFLYRLDEVVDYASQNEADLVVFAGDAFKNRLPNPTLQREFAWRVRDMATHCPVVLLVGNHDLPATIHRASSLEIYQTLDVPNVLVGDKYELYTVQTRNGPALVGTAPYPIRSRLVTDDDAHGKTMAQIDIMMQDAMQQVLADLAGQARASELPDAPRVLVGHFSVAGAQFSSERNIMVGRDAVVPLSELDDPAWDYVALGHIHKYQNLTNGRRGGPPVVYSGSLERIDFGEEHDPKGFVWVEVERGRTRTEFVPVNSRPFVTLRIDVRDTLDPTAAVLDAINAAMLEASVTRVYIQADADSEAKLRDDRIYAALREAGVEIIAGVKKEVDRPMRIRLGSSPEGLAPEELLERFLTTKEYTPDRIKRLLEHAKPLMHELGEGEAL